MLCPICGKDVKQGEGKYFPDGRSFNRRDYCTSLGIEENLFAKIETRRYICYDHFDECMFIMKKGKRTLLDNALPRKLTDDEKELLRSGDFVVNRFRQPKRSNNAMSNLSQTPLSNSQFYLETLPLEPPCSSSAIESPSSPFETPDIDFDTVTLETEDELENSQTKRRPKYLLVQTNCLEELLNRCHHCGHQPNNAEASLSFVGTACMSKLWCQNCGKHSFWTSQKRIPGRKAFEGNVEIISAAAVTPIPLASFLQFAFILDLAMFSSSTWYRVMPTFWSVVQKAYKIMQGRIFEYLEEKIQLDEEIHVTGDAQFDTRGFSAYLCCYSLMDAVSKFVLTNVCLDKREEKCASTHLEPLGLQRALAEIQEKGLMITSLTTDRSKSIITFMRAKHPSIIHMYDAWHVIKGVASILRLECKKVRGKNLKQWCQALLTHLWYSVTSAKGDGELCQQYVVSALLHTMGVHEWEADAMSTVLHDKQAEVLGTEDDDVLKNDPYDLPGNTVHQLVFDKHVTCGHPLEIEEEKAVLDPNSVSYGILQKTFTTDNFLNDVKHLSPELATSALEGFQGLVSNKYRSKNTFYNKKGFRNRTKLGYLHHNNNVWDELNGRRKVERVIERKAKHRGGEMVYKNIKTPTNYNWKKEILRETLLLFGNNIQKDQEELEESDTEDDNDNERESIGDLVADMFDDISDGEESF